MSDKEVEDLAKRIALALSECTPQKPEGDGHCHLNADEQVAVRDLIRTKKKAVKASLYLLGALVLWILKDIYFWISSHLTFIK